MCERINHMHKDVSTLDSVKGRKSRTDLLLLPSIGKGPH